MAEFPTSRRGQEVPTEIFGSLKLSTLLWGLIGGATAALFGPMTWANRAVTTMVGTITSTAFGPLLVNIAHTYLLGYFDIDYEDIMPPVIFLCGLTGMWCCSIVIEALRRVRKEAPEAVGRIIKRRTEG